MHHGLNLKKGVMIVRGVILVNLIDEDSSHPGPKDYGRIVYRSHNKAYPAR